MNYPRHILQSPLWATFRNNWGTKVIKSGNTQFTLHPVPFLPFNIGYMPRPYPEDIDWKDLESKAHENKCIYIKVEPNCETFNIPKGYNIKKGERMFAYATYIIDLQKSEEELLAAMHQKTRYNIRLAEKKGVKVKVGHDEKIFKDFLKLFHETENRQRFINHPDKYYKEIFNVFKNEDSVEIVVGYFENKPLAAMMVLFSEESAFYPYGGSTTKHKELMPFYLVMWEALKLGKKRGRKYFDMWNCLAPEQENENHPWYGFHRFKKGFNGELLRFPGAYDFVINTPLYLLVNMLNKLRWIILKAVLLLKSLIKR